MAYSTITDLARWIEEDELIQLCTLEADKTVADAEVTGPVNEAIASADGEIDSYLLGRWPGLRGLSSVPDELNRMSAILALYYLYLRKRSVPEDWRNSYKDVTGKLKLASEGKLSLGIDTSGTQASEGENQYRSDALDTDDDLDDDDRRQYTQAKLDKL